MEKSQLAKQIGKKIAEAREKAGLSRADVGSRLGLSERGYGHIEAGRSLITLDHLLQLPHILGKPLSFFLPHAFTEAELNDITHDPLFTDLIAAWQLLSELADLGDEAGANAKRALRLQAQAYKILAEERLKRKKEG